MAEVTLRLSKCWPISAQYGAQSASRTFTATWTKDLIELSKWIALERIAPANMTNAHSFSDAYLSARLLYTFL